MLGKEIWLRICCQIVEPWEPVEAEEGKLTGLGVGDTEGTEAEREDEDEGVEKIGAVIPVVGGVGWERAGEIADGNRLNNTTSNHRRGWVVCLT